MKLFKYPYLIQKEILSHIPYNSLFFLSLCSKKSLNLIVVTQKSKLQMIQCISYEIDFISMKIEANILGNKILVMEVLSEIPNDAQGFKEYASGTLVDFYRLPNSDFIHAVFIPNQQNSFLEAIHSQLHPLFGIHSEFSLQIKNSENVFPKLNHIQRVNVIGQHLGPGGIERLLSGLPNLQSFSWRPMNHVKMRLHDNTRIHQMDTVEISNNLSLALAILRNFNGRQAFLEAYGVLENDIIQFLIKWKRGKGFQNLEVLCVTEYGHLNEIGVKDGVKFKRLKTEVEYPVVRKFNPSTLKTEFIEFKTKFFIVRESDGRVASVLLKDDRVYLGVWNMAEKEFLEKFGPLDESSGNYSMFNRRRRN